MEAPGMSDQNLADAARQLLDDVAQDVEDLKIGLETSDERWEHRIQTLNDRLERLAQTLLDETYWLSDRIAKLERSR